MMEMNTNVKIIIASHKVYQMPKDDMYIPLHVGAEGKKDRNGRDLDLGYIKDNVGENISNLNSCFCELTGLYWAWKNIDADYIGLVHYRRHFGIKRNRKNPFDGVLTYKQLKPYLGKVKVFIPNKRNYYIETLYSHYKHTHHVIHLEETRKIIEKRYPQYLKIYDEVILHRYGYMFNMMIMEKSYLNEYCSWLFDILFELEKTLDIKELSAFQARCYGRISEIIFNVWLEYQKKNGRLNQNQIKEIPCIHIEKIDWWKKGLAFLKAKFFNRKYENSF